MKKKIFSIILMLCLMLQSVLFSFPAIASDESQSGTYIVGLKKDVDVDSFINGKNVNFKKLKRIKNINVLVTDLFSNEVESLKADPDVAYIEMDSNLEIASLDKGTKSSQADVYNMGLKQETPWGIKDIGVPQALENKLDGKKVKVAVLDTGISNHEDLKVAGGVSFVDGVSSYSDDNGHGTHVVGTIAALNNNKGVVGAASDADIYAVKVLDKNGSGTYSKVIEGIDWSIENEVNIISISFGGSVASQALHDAIKAAESKGILLIAAAGNRGAGENTLLYPAQYPEVLSVGAVDSFYHRASFSSTGPELDLVAPGVSILSTTSDGNYGTMSGTSMATPHVTGAVAAIWSQNINLTSQDIKNKLFETATYLGNTHENGHGLINLAFALGLVDGPLVQPVKEEPVPILSPEPTNDSFDINQIDGELIGLSNKLISLKETALAQKNIQTAKAIEESYNKLLETDLSLHRLPESLANVKTTNNTQVQINNYLARNDFAFRELEETYHKLIADYTKQLKFEEEPAATSQSELETSAYDKVGDGQTIRAGNSATVSLKLYEPKSQVDITVFNASNPSNILASSTRYNQAAGYAISFTWNTTTATPAGTYKIRYSYYNATGTTNYDDYFTIYVTESCEPNDTTSSAWSVSPGNSYTSFISSGSDLDYFKFTPSISGSINIKLYVPSTKDYEC